MARRRQTIRQLLLTAESRAELGARLGVSVQFFSDLCTGQRVGSGKTLVRIADTVGMSDELLGRSLRELVAHCSPRETRGQGEVAA